MVEGTEPAKPGNDGTEMLRHVVDSVKDYSIIILDPDGNIASWSPGAQHIKGWTAEEIIGEHMSRFYPRQDVLARKPQSELRAALADGRIEDEGWRIRKDGSSFWANVILTPLFDRSGRHLGFSRITRDLTGRMQVERQNAVLAAVFGCSPDAIVLIDRGGRIVNVNRRVTELFGFSSDELVGKTVEMLIPERFRDGHAALRTEFFRAPVGRQMGSGTVLRGRHADGHEILIDVLIAPVQLPHDDEMMGVAIVRDITERSMLEEQLHQAQRMQAVGQLTSGLSHDFNNLLTVIIGSLDLLAERWAGDENARTLVEKALSASLRGAETTRKLLAFSRKQQLAVDAVDLNESVNAMMALLSHSLGESIEIDVVVADDLWPAEIDPAQFEAALLNLAVNARDAMPDGGRLTIEIANRHLDAAYVARHSDLTAGDYVMVAVTDTGHGIPEALLARVIEPFFTTKAVNKGSGLGLSMVYGFCKQSAGHLNIYSEVGHGTTIRMYLPRFEGAVPQKVAAPEPEIAPSMRNELVLVVDDNADVRQVVVAELEKLGYRTLEASDAASALALLDATPDVMLLFTDIVMPGGMNGIELARAARSRNPALRVMYTSGFSEVPLSNGLARSLAGETLLSKPYRLHELAKKIRESLLRR